MAFGLCPLARLGTPCKFLAGDQSAIRGGKGLGKKKEDKTSTVVPSPPFIPTNRHTYGHHKTFTPY